MCEATVMNDHGQLAAAIQLALLRTGHFELRKIEVSIERGRVQLDGCVSTYYAKQLAQNAALGVDGVDHVDNGLTIV
jgi:osmotically-inducible protein OsmY